MATQVTFIGSGFSLESVVSQAPARVRVEFTSDPRLLSSSGPNDGLNPANYSLSGPGPATIQSVSEVSGRTDMVDLELAAPLAPGTWTLTVTNVETAASVALTSPTSLSFEVTSRTNLTDLTAGSENDTPARIIRKHLGPALRGPNWDALIEALSRGDDTNWENASLADDQIWISSASGKYLRQRIKDEGLNIPESAGLNDANLRELAVRLRTGKLTHEALKEILEIFYGRDALRAYVETETEATFALADGQTLIWTLDEQHEFTHTFRQDEFTVIGQATGLEVAAALTKTMSDNGSPGLAVAVVDPTTGGTKVRIYSASLGLRSFVRVTGGTAQPHLNFNDSIDAYTGPIMTPKTWTVTEPDQGQTQLQLIALMGLPEVDLTVVEPDDYVVVGPDVGVLAAGSYTVVSVETSWSGMSYIQTLVLDVPLNELATESFAGTMTQTSVSDLVFFRPTKQGINDGDRTVIVVQPRQGEIKVQIPATTAAVSRGVGSAAYLRSRDAIAIDRFVRTTDGKLNIFVDNLFSLLEPEDLTAHGKLIYFDGLRSHPSVPWVSPGTPGTFGMGPGVTAGSIGTCWSVAQTPPDEIGDQCEAIVDAGTDRSLFFTGGLVGGIATANAAMMTFGSVVFSQDISDGSQAEGGIRFEYNWAEVDPMAEARWLHCMSKLPDGRAFVTGGFDDGGSILQKKTTEIFDFSGTVFAWSPGPNMKQKRAGHQQVVLDDGRVFISGGCSGDTFRHDATATTELFTPGLLQFTEGPDMSVARFGHRALKLPDGRVMITGGNQMGTSMDIDSNVLAYWSFENTNGDTTVQDLGPNNYDWALSAGGTFSDRGRVGKSIVLSGSQHGTSTGDATATNALLGEWTVELWVPREISANPASDRAIVAYGDPTVMNPDFNILMQVGLNSSGRVFWGWENGAHSAVGNAQSVGPVLTDYNEGMFIAVRKRFEDPTYAVDLFINGDLVETWTGLANASGGSGSDWHLGWNVRTDTDGYQSGGVDELRVSSVALTNAQIRRDCELGNSADSWIKLCGACTNSVDFFDPTTNTIFEGPPMTFARAHHQMILLDDGRVLVFGGKGRDPTKPLPQNDMGWIDFWPNSGHRSAEIWDSTTNRWHPISDTNEAWIDACVVAHPDTNKLLIFNGYDRVDIDYVVGSARYADQSKIETLDLATLQWGHHFLTNSPVRSRAITHPFTQATVVTGSGVPSLLVPGADTLGDGQLNGPLLMTQGPLGDFSVQTDRSGFVDSFADRLGAGGMIWDGGAQDYLPTGWSNPITSIERTMGTVTLTCVTDGLASGQKVFVNVNTADPASGVKTISSVGPNSITYAEAGGNVGATAAVGCVTIDRSDDAQFVLGLQVADESEQLQGPFVFDPDASFNITDTKSELATGILKGSQISRIEVDDAGAFPDGVGYLVLDFGKATQSKAIKYLENVGDNILLLDSSWVPEFDYPVNTTVTLIGGREAWIPDPDEGANFYLTGTTAARLAAQKVVSEAAAAGMDLDFDVVYPGDTGLGGEGYPTEGDGKLSDVVRIWGGDE